MESNMKKLLVLATACAAAVVGFSKTITVTSTADTFPDAAEGSLRAALANAEDGDTITFLEDFEGPFKDGVYTTASNFVNGHILYVDGGILAYIGKQPQ